MKKILVVDDLPASRRLLAAFLGENYEILEAVDGQQCMERVMADMPDLVLLDLSLPRIDGIEVIRRMRGHPDLATIPIFALTAHSLQEFEERALSAGCNAYFVKPFSLEELKERVDALLGDTGRAAPSKGGVL